MNNSLTSFFRNGLATLTLFASLPFVSFLNTNREFEDYYYSILKSYLIYTVAIILVTLAINAAFRKTRLDRLSILGAVASLVFFQFLTLSKFLLGQGLELGTVRLAIWLLMFLVVCTVTWKLSKRSATLRVLTIGGAVMFVMPAMDFLFWYYTWNPAKTTQNRASQTAEAERNPNVYWIILDGYARGDVLDHLLGFDNGEFLEALRKRGFQVSRRSHSNYGSTMPSISTTVNMGYYLPTAGLENGWPGEERYDSSTDRRLTRLKTALLSGSNPVSRRFLDLKYAYLHAGYGGGSYKTRCGGTEDVCIYPAPSGWLSLDQAELNLLRLTPLYRVLRRLDRRIIRFDFLYTKDIAQALRRNELRPFYLFAHLLSPHYPARYNSDCTLRHDLSPVLYDGGLGTRSDYLRDIPCLNKEILSLVDLVLSTDRSDPIIILQGDHGYVYERHKEPELSSEAITLANLNAMRLPEVCRRMFYDEMSAVNTFRIVFACIEGAEPNLLRDRYFRHEKNLYHEVTIPKISDP